MSFDYRAKTIEECSELNTAIAKKQAFPNSDEYPDGKSLRAIMQDEVADVTACLMWLTRVERLDAAYIQERIHRKLANYKQWSEEV